jgi:hypothetical protein
MSELTGKFHDDMTVKLRCGGVLEGISYPDMIYNTKYLTLEWYADGTFVKDNSEHAFDIVEVLSKKPQMTLAYCLNSGNLCGGMQFVRASFEEKTTATVYYVDGDHYLGYTSGRPSILQRADTLVDAHDWILVEA